MNGMSLRSSSARLRIPCTLLVLLAVAVLVFSGPALAKKPGKATEQEGGQDLSGRVIDTEGKPVKKAEVFLYYNGVENDGLADRFIGTTKTKRDGSFRFKKAVTWPDVKPKNKYTVQHYSVIAQHPTLGLNFTVILQGNALDGAEVTLNRSHPANIKVVDTDGKPVEGAKVSLANGTFPEAVSQKLDRNRRYLSIRKDVEFCSGVTDAAGQVTLEGPFDPGFRANKPGYAEGFCTGDKHEIIMFPSARVAGKVTHEDGSAAAGAVVTFEYQGNRLGWSDAVYADDQGAYEFADVPAAGFRYSWMKPEEEQGGQTSGKIKARDRSPDSEYVATIESFPINPKDTLTKDIVLKRGITFAGKVLNLADDTPVKNMQFDIHIDTGAQYLDTVEMKTDENGVFKTLLSPGTKMSVQWEQRSDTGEYIIDEEWLHQNNYQPFRGTIDKELKDLIFKVKLWPVQPLKGRVVDAKGQAVKDASVYVHSYVDAVKTGADGAFTIKTAPTDRDFQLFAMSAEKDQAGLLSLKAGSTEATIPLEPTKTYDGLVLNTEGFPAANLKFYADLKLNGSSTYRVREEPTTGKDGTFKLEHACPKAAYSVFWSADNDENRDYDYGNAQFDLATLEPGKPIQFQAKQYLNALMGKVVNTKGDPIKGAVAQVQSWEIARQNESNKPVTTNEKGEFTIPRLAPGTAPLRVSAEGYKSARLSVSSDSIDAVITLSPATEPTVLTVHVVDQDGKPVPRVPIAFTTVTHDEKGLKHETKTIIADAKGTGVVRCASPAKEKNVRGILGCDLKGYTLTYRGLPLDQDTEVTLTIRKNAPCWAGRVVGQDGAPIAGATVRITATNEINEPDSYASLDGSGISCEFKTGADGRFELARFSQESSFSVAVTADGYAKKEDWFSKNRRTSAPKEATPEKVIQLSVGGGVTGKIVDKKTGQTLTGFAVILQNERSGRPADVTPDGTFKASNLEPGQYDVMCPAKDEAAKKYVGASTPKITVESGKTIEVVVEVEEGIPVRGKLVDKTTGKRPQGRCVVMMPKEGGRGGFSGEVKEDGTWQIYAPPGTFKLQYYIEGLNRQQAAQSLTVEAGKTYDNIVIEADTTPEK